MTKDVVISVRGLQVMDNESAEDIETVQQGEYFERNGSIFLLYDEYYEGFDEPVKNVMKIRGNEMTLTKRGIINVQMNFEAGKKNLTRYQTPYGVMMIGLDTSRVVCLQEEKSLAIEIDYTLEQTTSTFRIPKSGSWYGRENSRHKMRPCVGTHSTACCAGAFIHDNRMLAEHAFYC